MLLALRVVWFSLKALYSDLFLLVGASFVWFVLMLPLWLVAGITGLELARVFEQGLGVALPAEVLVVGFPVLSAIGPNPASAALGTLAAPIAQEELFRFSLIWQGLRRLWVRALLLWLVALLGAAMLLANVVFYWSSEHLALRVLGGCFLWALLYWIAMQYLVTPLLVAQPERPVWGILRNAAVITIAHPLYSATLLVVVLAGLALAGFVAIMTPLLLGAFLAVLGARAVAALRWRYFPEEAPRAVDELEEA